MQFRFPDQRETWETILGNQSLRELKKATTNADKRTWADEFVRTHNDFEWRKNDNDAEVLFNTITKREITEFDQAGEDVAKDIWVAMLADSLLDNELPFKKRKKSIKDARQAAKPVNFGIPGGMLPNRICALAKTDYGITLTKEEGIKAYKAWMSTFPEGVKWLADGPDYLIADPPFPHQPYYDLCFVLTGRLRGNLTKSGEDEPAWKRDNRKNDMPKQGHDEGVNEWHNTQFQGLAADLAKLALFRIWWQGLIQVNFIHDENLTESPEKLADEHAEILETEMRQAADQVMRLIHIGAAAKKMRVWQK